ncbi:helix-turn-helix transcriptional regulator [Williamsia sp.]|uniref:helix-turn-helix domain-containing protein n=1 Tax=Williamsia sp. TaxID=1872085 RepID=UPI001A345278|nr:helix-turn-helix transcriptional regulator [Williamsia sp.]MBJ7288883.1 helix-turn-helix transcriptional regulator [Williamsia sp.]
MVADSPSRSRGERPVGELLRQWRSNRRRSQLDLAVEAGISSRHVSFIETGRSRPTAAMILRLAEHLDVPLRERNQLLLAGGFAPAYGERDLDTPELAAVCDALRRVVAAHMPFPALVLDRHFDVVEANEAVATVVEGCAPELLTPPVNVIRLGLHPEGMAPRITNLDQWRAHLLTQLTRRAGRTGDRRLIDLLDEVRRYPRPARLGGVDGGVAVELRLRHRLGDLAFLSMAASVQTALDVTVDELTLELFHPADDATRALMESVR